MSKKQATQIGSAVARPQTSSLVWEDQNKLHLTYSNLVVRVSRINRHYGLVRDFVNAHAIHGVTNGRLLIISEMDTPARYLHSLSRTVLRPLGFRYADDYIYAEEQFVHSLDNYNSDEPAGQEIPACRRALWLGGEINEEGNWVWLKNGNISAT